MTNTDTQVIVQTAQVLSDETRVKLLLMLAEQPATVNDLVTRLAMDQARVSAHLAVLRRAKLVTVEKTGRQNMYHLTRQPELLNAFDVITRLGSDQQSPAQRAASPSASREVQRNSLLRQSRTCYDHLAGVAGVRLLQSMIDAGWLVAVEQSTRPAYDLTEKGKQALEKRGVELAAAALQRRKFAYGCPDWTERQPHLGGSLGAAILQALEQRGYVERNPNTRAVQVVHDIQEWLHNE